MKILVDTNVIINFLEDPSSNGCANDDSILMRNAINKKFIACISASAVTDICYILARSLRESNKTKPLGESLSNKEIREKANKMVSVLFTRISILTVTEKEIKDAFTSRWKDVEDAVQYFTAKANKVDAIVTWNKKDFRESDIPVYTPTEYLAELHNSNQD